MEHERTASARFIALQQKENDQQDLLLRHLEKGVNFMALNGVFIDVEVLIAPGATILPGCILRGKTKIGAGSIVGPNAILEDAILGENVIFNASQGYECQIGDGTKIGPFVHIRPNSIIGAQVKIGDFVEVKNATIGDGTSIAHLTYIGDSDVGRHCNFGCGVVTVNYDGENKNRTTVGDYAFIGCNSNLVAPVKIGNGAYTAAGSTITQDVPDGALGIARVRQENKENWAIGKLKKYISKHTK